jgi:hypothetical protein
MLAGAGGSAALAPALDHPLLSIVWGVTVGATYSASLRPTRHAYVDNLMTGAALGIPLGPDQGYHSGAVVVNLQSAEVRTYIPGEEAGKAEEQQAVYANGGE